MNDSASNSLERVVIETGSGPSHAVIWLHGLGADGHDFEPIVPHLKAAARRPTRFVFPHAPVRPVTVNGGMAMRAWYDILGVDIDRDQDMEGIMASAAATDRLIDEQIDAGIPAGNVIVAGFSQGGAIALRCALARDQRPAGVLALSTYLVEAGRLGEWCDQSARDLPVFMGHGSQDPVVPVALGKESAETLKEAGFDVEWRTWPMAHAVCAEEIEAIDAWLDRCWA